MWYVILTSIVLVVVAITFFIAIHREGEGVGFSLLSSLILSMVAGMCLLLIGFFLIPATTGLVPEYSVGSREGFLTKVSTKGIIWKTHEAEMQMGVGTQAALQEPFGFSISREDTEIWNKAQVSLGQHVRVQYSEWLIMPFRIGSSGYRVIDLALVND